MNCSKPGSPVLTISWSLPKLMSIESLMLSNHLILCHPLLLLPSIFPSIRVFSNELVLHIRWPKYWSFSFNISLSNEYSALVSFKMDWFDFLAVQGTLKSLQHLQHHNLEASALPCSAFFMVLLSHPYMTTGKTIFTYLFVVVLGLRCCAQVFSSCSKWVLLLVAVPRTSHCNVFSCYKAQTLGTEASVVVAHQLSSCSVQPLERRLSSCDAHGLSCSPACGIFPDQGPNPCLLLGRQILIHCTTRDVQFA